MSESTPSFSHLQLLDLNTYNVNGKAREYDLDTTLSERERNIRAAAFLDAEGSIIIIPNSGSGYQLKIAVASTTIQLLQWFKANYGGSIHKKSPASYKDGITRKPAWDWVIASALAERFLYLIHPFLLIKQEQAIIALEFRLVQRQHKGLSPEEKKASWHPYYERIRELNDSKGKANGG